MRRALAVFAVLLSLSAAAEPAPAHILHELPQARLAGQGVYTWFGLKVYEARLFVGERGVDSAAPAAAPFVLDLRYARKLAGARIAAASADQMARTGAATAAQREQWLRRMTALFPDVEEGSHISGAWQPGAGARFYLDGKLIGTIAEPEFGRAFFGIWLSSATTAPALREALLKDAAPR
jgi:hypothetical protein